MKKYPDDVTNFVKQHGHEGSIEDMRRRVNEIFMLDLSYSRMKAFFQNHKIHAAPMRGRKRPESSKYPNDMEEFIRSIAWGKGNQKITDAVNEKYGEGTITLALLKVYKSNHKISSGLTGHFEKGHIPHNKGKKQTDFMTPEGIEKRRETCCKKGHIPHNGGNPIGTIRKRLSKGKKPYYSEKVDEPNVWRMKHVLVWEEANGPVPEGSIVTFANGNTLDYRLENLVLETRAQNAIKNKLHMRGYDKASAQTANLVADLVMAQKRRRK